MALVTVSREEGSWGGDIARGLASRLGYRLLDRKALLAEAEGYGGISPTAPELDEKRPGFWERLDQERRRYSVLLRTVVYNVALEDNVVFLGRGTGMLLGEVTHALSVLVICSVPVRIARIMGRGAGGRPGPMTREQAEEIVRRSDRDRAAHVRYLFQKDWLDPQYHDIVINSAVIEVPAATDILAEMVGSGRYDPTPESREQLERLAQSSRENSARLAGSRH